jgi:predicted kinase
VVNDWEHITLSGFCVIVSGLVLKLLQRALARKDAHEQEVRTWRESVNRDCERYERNFRRIASICTVEIEVED